MDKKTAEKLLLETKNNYNSFAESFSATRNYLGPEIKFLLGANWKPGAKTIDIGCGNGRCFEFFKENRGAYVGVDNSESMIAVAQKKFPEAEFMAADALDLPFGPDGFDMAISFAVIHHIPSKDLRQKFFREAWRILKPGGKLIVSAWNLQPLFLARSKHWKRLKYFFRDQIKIAFGLEKGDLGDFFIPWQNKYRRYVRAMAMGEMKKLAKNAGFQIEKAGIAKVSDREGNLYIVAKKCEKNNVV